MGITDNIKKGATELVLMGLLAERDMYGYEMAQALRERSGGRFILQESSMYPPLYRLQDNGYISARKELVGKRRTRTYYHLEPAGRAYFRANLAEYMAMQDGICKILAAAIQGENYDGTCNGNSGV